MADTDNTGLFLDLGAGAFSKCSSYLQGVIGLFEKRDDGAKRLNPEAFQCLFLFSPSPFLGGRKPVDVEYSIDCGVKLQQLDVDKLLSEAVKTLTGNSNAKVERSIIRDFLFNIYRAAQIDAKIAADKKDSAGFQRDLGAITKLLNAMLTGGEGWPRKNENPIDRAIIEITVSYASNIASTLASFIPQFGGAVGQSAKATLDFLFFIADYLAEYRAAYAALAYRLSGNERYERIANAYASRYGSKPSTFTVRKWCLAGGEGNPDFAPDGTTTAYLRAVEERKALVETLKTVPSEIATLFGGLSWSLSWDGAENPLVAESLLPVYGAAIQPDTDARFNNAIVEAIDKRYKDSQSTMGLLDKATAPVLFTAYSTLYAAMLGVYTRSDVDQIIKNMLAAGKDEESLVASMANVLNANECGLTADAFNSANPGNWGANLADRKTAYREMAENIGVRQADNGTPAVCPKTRLWMPYWEDTVSQNFNWNQNELFANDYRLHLRRIIRSIMFLDGFNACPVTASFWGGCTLLSEGGCTTKFNIRVFPALSARYIGNRLREVERVWDIFAQKMVPNADLDVRRAFLTYFFHVAQPNRQPLVNDLAQLFNEWAAQNGGPGDLWRNKDRFDPIINGLKVFNSPDTLMLWMMTGTTTLGPVPTPTAPQFKGVIAACPGGPDDLSCLPCDIIKERRPVGLPELTVPMELTWTGVKGVKGSPEYAAWVKLFTDAGYPGYYIDCTFRDVKVAMGAGATEPEPTPDAAGKCPSGYAAQSFGKFVKCVKIGQLLPLNGMTPMSMQGIQRPLMVELAGRKK